MAWTSFFTSRAFKFGSLSCGIGLATGATASTLIAQRIASMCTTAANEMINKIGDTFTIPTMDAVVHYEQYNASISLDNINAGLPQSWLDIIHDANDVSPYCFEIPLAIGLSQTILFSMILTLATVMFIREQDKAPIKPVPLEACVSGDDEPLLGGPGTH